MKLGISVFFDPTVGTIRSDFLFLNKLVKLLGATEVTFVSIMKRAGTIVERYASDLTFDYRVLPQEEVGHLDAIVTWNNTNFGNFFGGRISKTYLRQHLFLAQRSAAGVPILVRAGDSENEVLDYRHSVAARLAHERGKGSTKFAAENAAEILALQGAPEIDYDNFYLLVNGERDRFDWVSDTYERRLSEKHRHFTPRTCQNALYLGDELFFQVLERKAAYDELKRPVKVGDHLFWIGFLEYRNGGRRDTFNKLFSRPLGFKMVIQTPVQVTFPGATTVTKTIVGDTPEYFKHLGRALGYVFIGKGTERCAYVNKTVYDCFVAGTPVLVYQPTDQGKMIFPELSTCYFSSQVELQSLYKKLTSNSFRDNLVAQQASLLTARLSSSSKIPLKLTA